MEQIGVQAPEFEFEKQIQNVQWAVKDKTIRLPCAPFCAHGFRECPDRTEVCGALQVDVKTAFSATPFC